MRRHGVPSLEQIAGTHRFQKQQAVPHQKLILRFQHRICKDIVWKAMNHRKFDDWIMFHMKA